MEKCRSCNAEVLWITTSNGKKMPLDAEPVRFGGNIRLHDDGTITVLTKDDPRNSLEKLYRSHFATCPERKKWRKKK